MNWYIGLFKHKKNDPKHKAVVRYNGMTCVGYVCEACGYKWYEKRVNK